VPQSDRAAYVAGLLVALATGLAATSRRRLDKEETEGNGEGGGVATLAMRGCMHMHVQKVRCGVS